MNTNTTNSQTSTSTKFVVLFVMFFISSFGFAQTTVVASTVSNETSITSNDDTVTTTTTATAVEANANMNMVSWFMGTKQTPKANTNAGDASFSKKSMINSGTAPNRLLMKAFLKKAASYSSTIA